MATSRILLDILDWYAPDGTAGNVASDNTQFITSAGTPPANAPKVRVPTLDFDQSTDEHRLICFRLPSDYVSGGTLIVSWGATPTSGNVIIKASSCCIEPSSGDIDAAVFDTVVLSAATAVPGTTVQFKDTSLALPMSGADAGDLLVIMLGRDGDNGSDNAAGDMRVVAVTFEYTNA